MEQPPVSPWATLPKEIVEALGFFLDASGWAAARATCLHWSRSITHGITLLEVDLERDAHRWMMTLTCVARLFPRLTSIALLCGSRITPAIFDERMAALSITSIQLQELELRFLYLSNPRLGVWLEDLSGVTEIRSLQLLRLAGGATPSVSFFEKLTSMKRLRVLEVLPGVYGQIAGYDMDVGQAGADEQQISNLGVRDDHLAAIGKLTQLLQLTIKVCPRESTPSGLAALNMFGLLSNLEHLAMYDAELPCESLAQHLSGATRLTGLQFGLSSVSAELSTLRSLPNLKAIGFDTAFLPSLQALMSAALAARIPQHGAGSITSLCLLDQTISCSQQLASLTQLNNLAELVLVNPLFHRPPATAPTLTQHPHQHGEQPQHPQQTHAAANHQQQMPIDMAALAGLSNLRLLQVDLGGKGTQGPEAMSPLPLLFTRESVQQLAAAWTALETLDLSGFGPEMLPESALLGLSSFTSLRALSIMHPEGAPHLAPDEDMDLDVEPVNNPLQGHGVGVAQPLAAAAAPPAAGSAGSSRGSDASMLRSVPWWKLPTGLVSLFLSHMDLSGRGQSQCNVHEEGGSSCECCLGPFPAGQHQIQRQQLFGLGLSLFQNRASPLRPLSKRRRQTQQRGEPVGPSGAAAADAGTAGSSICHDDGGSLAAATATSQADMGAFTSLHGAPICSCASVLPEHFKNLQALWLEQVTLAPSVLPRVLSAVSTRLESLALLHVSGTRREELSSLSCVTSLTSLRLIPSDHDVGGLEPLLPMKHLKKLSVKLTHLRPADLMVLSRLRSLFCLILAAPCVNGALFPGFASAVRLQQVEEVVSASLQYCDIELQAEPEVTSVVL